MRTRGPGSRRAAGGGMHMDWLELISIGAGM